MERYYFDVTGPAGSEYDYQGLKLLSPHEARQTAELFALDLATTSRFDGLTFSVAVRTADGRHLFSIASPCNVLAATGRGPEPLILHS